MIVAESCCNRRRPTNRFARCLFAYIFFACVCVVPPAMTQAATITINQNTTIDASNSFPEPPPAAEPLVVNIVNGATPPVVQIIDGGVIGGFVNVYGNSQLFLTGGRIDALTTVFDQATLTLNGGSVEPLIDFYDAADPAGVLRVVGMGTINLRGGKFFGVIQQYDSSEVNIFGHSFVVDGELPTSMNALSGVHISGIYSTGEPFSIDITRHSSSAQVYLYAVPEPEIASPFVAFGFPLLFGRKRV